MTADIELLPLPEADGFMESFDIYSCPVGADDAWAEESAKHYARANVAHAVAPLQAEIERLRAEVDRANSWNARVSVCRDHVADIVDGLCVICSLDAAEDRYNNLQEEVERLRAIAGCAYQMAGVHDAPEVWLDRLGQAANGDALPDPDTISDELLPYQPDAVCEAEARAERLAEALRRYGVHDQACVAANIPICTCGLDAALEQEAGRG